MAEYIEREVAKAAMRKRFGTIESRCEVNEVLNSIPAADVREVVRGKWENDSDNLPVCSNCGEVALQRMFVKVPHLIAQTQMVLSNFCPNCGADMREVQDA